MSIDTFCFRHPVTESRLAHYEFHYVGTTPLGFHKFLYRNKEYFFLKGNHNNGHEYFFLEFTKRRRTNEE